MKINNKFTNLQPKFLTPTWTAIIILFIAVIFISLRIELIDDLQGKIIDASTKQMEFNQLIINNVMEMQKKKVANITVTAYSPRERETDSTPHITAFMTPVRNRTIALPWHLIQQGWLPGKCAYLKINDYQFGGIYKINDQMNERYQYRADIFFFSTNHAVAFGRLYNIDMVYLGECP